MTRLLTLAAAAILALPVLAQDPPKAPKENEWLKPLLGDWTTEGTEAGKEAEKAKGSAGGRMLGDLWLLLEVKSEEPGDAFSGRLTLGWDVGRKKFAAAWVDTKHPRLSVFSGSVDGAQLVLEAEGPGAAKEKFRETIEIKDKDLFVLTSSEEREGKRVDTYRTQFRRKWDGPTSSEPPPPPKAEDIKVRAGFIWISGHWTPGDGKWNWIDGHWERERAGCIYVQGRWEKSGDLFHWVPGDWQAAK